MASSELIIPSNIAWDICADYLEVAAKWIEYLRGDLGSSSHGIAAVLFSSMLC